MATFEGGCACGRARYRMTSAPLFVHCCHCLRCQRETGSAFVLNALIETDRLDMLADAPAAVAVPTDSGNSHRILRCEAARRRSPANTAASTSCALCGSAPSTRRTR